MAYNKNRAERMALKSERELLEIVKVGSLSAAAAEYQLDKRGFNRLAIDKRFAEEDAKRKNG